MEVHERRALLGQVRLRVAGAGAGRRRAGRSHRVSAHNINAMSALRCSRRPPRLRHHRDVRPQGRSQRTFTSHRCGGSVSRNNLTPAERRLASQAGAHKSWRTPKTGRRAPRPPGQPRTPDSSCRSTRTGSCRPPNAPSAPSRPVRRTSRRWRSSRRRPVGWRKKHGRRACSPVRWAWWPAQGDADTPHKPTSTLSPPHHRTQPSVIGSAVVGGIASRGGD